MTDPTDPTDLTNAGLFERAQRVIPGGVNSPVRAFRSVGGSPYFVARAEGPYVWDVEGRRYTDFVQSYGAIIAGHAHPVIVEAIRDAAGDGTSYGAPTEREVLLAEAICERVPSCEMVRLGRSGPAAPAPPVCGEDGGGVGSVGGGLPLERVRPGAGLGGGSPRRIGQRLVRPAQRTQRRGRLTGRPAWGGMRLRVAGRVADVVGG